MGDLVARFRPSGALAMTNQSETHPGAVVAPTQADVIRRDTIASAYRAIQHAQTADECRLAIAAMGNKGSGG